MRINRIKYYWREKLHRGNLNKRTNDNSTRFSNLFFSLGIKVVIIILFITSSCWLVSCTDLFSNPNSSTNVSDRLNVRINNPVSDDTIGYYGTYVNYTLKIDVGIHAVELYVDGKINKWAAVNADGSQPTLPLTLDSSMIGQRISYNLVYYDNDGLYSVSDTMKNILIKDVEVPPSRPFNLSLAPIPPNTYIITWKDTTKKYPPGFEIWRKTGYYGKFKLYLSAPPGSNNINDDNVIDTTVYYYTIKAINKYGLALSDTINTYGAGAARSIAPPTDLKGVALSTNEVKLTWVNNIKKETYLKIERRYYWSNFATIGKVPKGSTSYIDSASGLVPGVDYRYRIKAISSNDSSWSNEVSVTTPTN